MEEKNKKKQTALRIVFGLGVILLVFLIEIYGIHPTGIYYYKNTGYKGYKIGMSKEEVLGVINQNRSIRTIRVCEPAAVLRLTSRKPFEMDSKLEESDHWICYDWRGDDYLFGFRDGTLKKILIQRLRMGHKKGSKLFTRCDPLVYGSINKYLMAQKELQVFYKDKKR